MSWRDDYRIGSFRGVPFRSQGGDREGGRRIETHEYPGRDEAWSEDLGRRARRWHLDVFVAGDDYMVARDALIDAVEADGAGTLVHPWQGSYSVKVDNFSTRESTDDGGICYFSIDFVEAGEPATPVEANDTSARAVDQADAAEAEAPDDFERDFSIEDTAAFVEASADTAIKYVSSAMKIVAGFQNGVGPGLLALQSQLGVFDGDLAEQLRAPLDLAQQTVRAVQLVQALGGSVAARIAGFTRLMSIGDELPPVTGATAARQRQRDNRTAYLDLVRTAAAAELVRTIATAVFDSYDQAVAIRDAASDAIDARLVKAADAGRDRVADRYQRLLIVMVADVTARGGSLERIYSYTPGVTAPAIVIAHRLYGPADTIARAGDIVLRNRIRHPGFVLGGVPIEVREAARG